MTQVAPARDETLSDVLSRLAEQQRQIERLISEVKDIRLEVELLKNAGHSSIKMNPELGPWTGS
jgi:chaperonin cofactor prefoldin